jgi:hypothetical protein
MTIALPYLIGDFISQRGEHWKAQLPTERMKSFASMLIGHYF